MGNEKVELLSVLYASWMMNNRDGAEGEKRDRLAVDGPGGLSDSGIALRRSWKYERMLGYHSDLVSVRCQ